VVGQLINYSPSCACALAFFGYRGRGILEMPFFIFFESAAWMVDGGWGDSIIMCVRYCALAYCGGDGGDLFFFPSPSCSTGM